MSILEQGFEYLRAKYAKFGNIALVEELKDVKGVFAYRIFNEGTSKSAYFAAHGPLFGNLVSLHFDLFVKAQREGIPIIVCLDGNKFYRFFPKEIIRVKATLGIYREIETISFPIGIGESLQKKTGPTKNTGAASGIQSAPVKVGPASGIQTAEQSEEEKAHPVVQTLIREMGAEKIAERQITKRVQIATEGGSLFS